MTAGAGPRLGGVAALLGALGLCSVSGQGCAIRTERTFAPGVAVLGVYRATFEESGGEPHRFRLLLFAAAPDRLHGEILGPLGSPAVIVDGGGGALSVALVRERVAYVGRATGETIRAALGIDLALEDLVGGLLDGKLDRPGHELERTAEGPGLLPQALDLRGEGFRLRLERKELRPLSTDPAALGRGTPPPGMPTRPIEDLAARERPAIFLEDLPP